MTGINTLIKRQRLSDWIKTQHPTTCCLQKVHFKYKNNITNTLKVKEWKEIYQANTSQKEKRLATLKLEQRILPGIRSYFIIIRIKESIHQRK